MLWCNGVLKMLVLEENLMDMAAVKTCHFIVVSFLLCVHFKSLNF